jgi:hypothetical protein
MEQERERERPRGAGPGGDGGDDSGRLDRLRSRGQRFHQAANDVVNRALSDDPMRFLTSNVQEGGQ